MNAVQDCRRKETTDGDEQRIDSLEATAKKQQGQALRRMTESTCGSSASLSDMDQNSDAEMESTQAAKSEATKKADDPFLYFSSHKRRMEHLVGREMPHLSSEPVVRRRSRISFELDPFFDLMTTFPDLEGEWFEEEAVQG